MIKALQTKHLINLTLSTACWQNHKNPTACEVQLSIFREQTFLQDVTQILNADICQCS